MSTRGELADIITATVLVVSGSYDAADHALAHLAERGMIVLGPDGEPVDVRPLFHLAGKFQAMMPGDWLARHNITGPLAQKCLDLASEGS